MFEGRVKEVEKQAQQRIDGRFFMYVLGSHNSTLKNTQRVDVMETLQNHKTQKSKRLLEFREEAQSRNDRGALP